MANREEYRFDVNANTEQADKAIDQLINKFSKLEGTINRINKKGFEDNYTTNQKDMDKSMRSLAAMSKQMLDAHKYIQGSINKSYREMGNVKAPKPPRRPNQPHEPAPIRKNARKDVRDEYDKKYASYQKRMNSYQNRMDNYNSQMKQYEKEKTAYDKRAQAHEEFVNRMVQSERKLQRMLNNSQKSHQDTQGFEQNYSKNFKHKLNSNNIYNMPGNPEEAKSRMKALFEGQDPLETSNNKVIDQIKSVQRLRRRNDSLSRRGAAAGSLSYQQAKNFQDDYVKSQTKLRSDRDANFAYAGKLGSQRSQLQEKIGEIEKNPEKFGDDGYHTKIGYQQNVKAIDEEIQHRKRLNAEIEQTMVEMQEYRDRLLSNNVSVDAKRGSFARNMSERSAAIGLAMGGTIAGTFVNMYSQGASVDKAMRDQLIYSGQSTGMNGKQWGSFESNTINAGLNNRMGMTGQEMMQFQNDYMQNAGFHGFNDLSSATTNQANFSRATGIDSSTTGSFFGAMAQTGGMNGSQIKDFQDGFVGAIKESGMQGRQQQQLQALQSIVQNVSQDKSLSSSQLNSVVGLQSLLASSGNRSMQGQNGADFMNQMNAGIKGSFWNPQMRMIFGAGTKYQGGAGMWQLEKQMNAGIVGKDGLTNLQTMYNYAKTNGGNSKGYQNYLFSAMAQQTGANLSTDQVETFMNMGRQGKLTEKNVQEYMDKAKKTGAKESAKNAKNYKDSSAATNNQSDAVYQKQAKALYDNTEILRKINASLGQLNPFLYAGTLAVGALTGMLATTIGSFGFSTAIKSMATGTFGDSIGNLGKNNMVTRLWNKTQWGKRNPIRGPEDRPTPTGKGPTAPDDVPPGFKRTPSGIIVPTNTTEGGGGAGGTGFFGKVGNGFKSMGGNAVKFFSENPIGKTIGKGLSSAWSLAGKLAMPLAVAGGIYHVATAKKGQHVKATGEAAGNIGGMLAGARVGAGLGARAGFGIGKFFGPEGAAIGTGIGTVVGTIGGGIAGSSIGKRVGGWIGGGAQKLWNGVTGLFSPTKAEAAELPKSMQKTTDKNNTTTKARTEDKRTYNVQNESANLGTQGKQLNQMQQLLAQARQQNGIIGSMNGLGGGTSGGIAGVGGGAGMTNASGNQASIWNHFAQQGYSASAISGILGNIGTETGGTFDPKTKQKGGPGMGLAQWTNTGRWKDLQAYAKKNGMDPSSMQAQLGFMSQEMSQMGLTPDKMNGLSTSQATSLFEQKYEGAGKPNMSSRNNYANQAYSQFANSPQAQPTTGQTSQAGATHTINSNINVNLTSNGNAADQIANNSALQSVGQRIQQMIYGSMGYYSTETQRR